MQFNEFALVVCETSKPLYALGRRTPVHFNLGNVSSEQRTRKETETLGASILVHFHYDSSVSVPVRSPINKKKGTVSIHSLR